MLRNQMTRTALTNVSQERLVMAHLNQLIEPNDFTSNALLELMSPVELLDLVKCQDHVPQGLKGQVDDILGFKPSSNMAQDLKVALTRWRKRLPLANPQAALDTASRNGGGLLLNTDPGWPEQLNELNLGRPMCLWWRAKNPQLLSGQDLTRNVAIVGSRDASEYGDQVTFDLSRTLALRGYTIVSGGAYGIDASAHRAALSVAEWNQSNPPTIAVMAGGIDRLYPSGNSNLLNQVILRGVLLSEVPPGTTSARFRFLNRNRIIAALSRLVIVTEARHRSGALNTVSHAVELNREVAAVPGSVFAPNSAGCHRLIAEGSAALLTSPQEALQLVGAEQTPQPDVEQSGMERPTDRLGRNEGMVYDCMSFARGIVIDEISARSGVPVIQTLQAVGRLEALGMASTDGMTWKLVHQGS
ncbi:DNA-processing protein DprA [Glutamicibacter sp. JC586]|uniref:DNA-processing protein DprA n=1 Tax=Glutamicibacter sp. JC586 TaxID=2590552 RepID=UPI00135C1852|nr:DNA-processing protein DprA [Glutamicibacter sp. JC586]